MGAECSSCSWFRPHSAHNYFRNYGSRGGTQKENWRQNSGIFLLKQLLWSVYLFYASDKNALIVDTCVNLRNGEKLIRSFSSSLPRVVSFRILSGALWEVLSKRLDVKCTDMAVSMRANLRVTFHDYRRIWFCILVQSYIDVEISHELRSVWKKKINSWIR